MSAKRVEFIAHRGESFIAPENTLAAFDLAWSFNDDACELDTHLTKDGKLILSHDADTLRTCGVKKIIKESTFADLRTLDAGGWKDPKYKGEKLPLLETAIAGIPSGKRLFIEIKCGPEATDELARVIEQSGKQNEQLVIISFYADTLKAAKERLPKLKAYYLADFRKDKQTGQWTPSPQSLIDKAKQIGADGLNIGAQEPVTKEFVAQAHAEGLEFYCWTIDDLPTAQRMTEAGVDGITTNRAKWLAGQLGINRRF